MQQTFSSNSRDTMNTSLSKSLSGSTLIRHYSSALSSSRFLHYSPHLSNRNTEYASPFFLMPPAAEDAESSKTHLTRAASSTYSSQADDWEEPNGAHSSSEAARHERTTQQGDTPPLARSTIPYISTSPTLESLASTQPHPVDWRASGMMVGGHGSNTTLGRGGSQLIQGYLNFSAL